MSSKYLKIGNTYTLVNGVKIKVKGPSSGEPGKRVDVVVTSVPAGEFHAMEVGDCYRYLTKDGLYCVEEGRPACTKHVKFPPASLPNRPKRVIGPDRCLIPWE